jgi:putative ATP-dependent endonuclease of the OLD family
MSKDFENFSLKVKNFKCFGEEEQGFEQIKPINLIIGRNNSGKSALLDLIDYAIKDGREIPQLFYRKSQYPEMQAEASLTEDELQSVFIKGRGLNIAGMDPWKFGQQFIDTRLKWVLDNRKFISISECLNGERPLDYVNTNNAYSDQLAKIITNPLQKKIFRRIHAERNIVSEPESNNVVILGDGSGATNTIQEFINRANLPSNYVEGTLLRELNKIFATDAEFTDIVCQKLDSNNWEIFLQEETKGRIALSQSGSGLKTVILVLIYLYLAPHIDKLDLSNYIFAFEELENNLHPALLRRLLNFLYEKAINTGCTFFLTTHSNVAIDFFSRNSNAQIIHVTHDGHVAKCRTVTTYVDDKGILDDLDVRASDLLQSNAIIWVEGPSDRIYLNRWISLWSDGKLQEGFHYQCVFYGGRLLAHLSADSPDEIEDEIAIFRVNRNAAIMIDSDKRSQQASINDTKKRLLEEISKMNGLSWLTKGKEVENYLPSEVIAQFLNVSVDKVSQVDQYQDFFDYLDGVEPKKGIYYRGKKPMLAEQLSPYFTKESLSETLDLREKLDDLCTRIRKWNGLD